VKQCHMLSVTRGMVCVKRRSFARSSKAISKALGKVAR
jgi:hypothetical protein